MADCQHCLYGLDGSFYKGQNLWECQNLDYEPEWLKLDDCPEFYERPTKYDIKLSEV